MLRLAVFLWAAACFGLVGAAEVQPLEALRGKKVAVAVFAQDDEAKLMIKAAQSRLEEVLADNDMTVLDESKAQELKDVFRTLENPGAFVTAETFVENAKKFEIHGLFAVYVSAEVIPGLADYFSATAHADIRFIDNTTARVRAFSTPPMGAPGSPPSDGLTRSSASLNAVQRALDTACELTGLRLAERTRAKTVDLGLAGPERWMGGEAVFAAPANERSLWGLAALDKEKWRSESVTCTARAPAGGLAAVAGYIADTTSGFGGGIGMGPGAMRRLYGSRIHVVDTVAGKSINTFVCSPVELSGRDEPNTKKVLACLFVGNWRYLCAVTGNHILLWNVEKGTQIAKLAVPAEPTRLALQLGKEGSAAIVRTGRTMWRYNIVRANH